MTMADVSHIGGLIAGGVMSNPCDHGFDFVTTTTHKSLRGPRGGMILTKRDYRRKIDSSVFPGLQGGPHMNQVAGAAVALGKALEPEFRVYAREVLDNARTLAEALMAGGAELVTGGTDNHLMVLDCVASFGIDGRVAEEALDAVGITTNKQVIPDDPNPPLRPSGIRLGTPAATTRGMGRDEMKLLAGWILNALRNREDESACARIRSEVEATCSTFPVPGLDD